MYMPSNRGPVNRSKEERRVTSCPLATGRERRERRGPADRYVHMYVPSKRGAGGKKEEGKEKGRG